MEHISDWETKCFPPVENVNWWVGRGFDPFLGVPVIGSYEKCPYITEGGYCALAEMRCRDAFNAVVPASEKIQ